MGRWNAEVWSPAIPPEGNCGEGNRPHALDVALPLKLAATQLLFPPAAALPARLQTVSWGLTSTAPIQTTHIALETECRHVEPSQGRGLY